MFITGKCSRCRIRKEYNDSYCSFCADHDHCSFEQDERLPKYSYKVAKQLIFDCIMELECGHEEKNNKQISTKLQDVLKELDKMNVIEIDIKQIHIKKENERWR